MLSEYLESDSGMTLGVAVSDDHVDIFAYALCSQSSLGEAGSHGEEVNGSVVLAGEDGSHFGILDVYTVDNQVKQFAVSQFHSLVVHGDSVGSVKMEVFVSQVKFSCSVFGFL